MSAIASALSVFSVKFVNHSLGVSTCLTSRQHRFTSIRIFCRILAAPLPCSSFAENDRNHLICW